MAQSTFMNGFLSTFRDRLRKTKLERFSPRTENSTQYAGATNCEDNKSLEALQITNTPQPFKTIVPSPPKTNVPSLSQSVEQLVDAEETAPSPVYFPIGLAINGMSRRYEYEKLTDARSIRLLHVNGIKPEHEEGTTFGQAISFSLHMFNLENAPPYEAISYVWGTNDSNRRLILEDGSYMPITQSLFFALPSLARKSRTQYLWIDQLCIDQATLSEMNHQIKVMGDIYRHSRRVMISLKHLGPDPKLLFPMFKDAADIEKGLLKPESLEMKFASESRDKDRFDQWKTVVWLMNNSWFTRAWTFQEAVLAPEADFVIGQETVSFDTIFRLAFTVHRFEVEHLEDFSLNGCVSMSSGYDHLYAMARLRRSLSISGGKMKHDFWELLSDLAPTSQSSVPVDILYAFLGLMNDEKVQLEPDHALGLPEACRITARAVISGRKSLDIYGYLERESGKFQTASWAPNWGKPPLVIPLWSPSFLPPFDAADGRSYDASVGYYSSVNDFLPVRGAIVDTIIAVCQPFTSEDHWSRRHPVEFLSLIERGQELDRVTKGRINGCQDLRLLLRVALADCLLHLQETSPKSVDSLVEFDTLVETYRELDFGDRTEAKSASNSTMEQKLRNLSRIAFNRRMCLTQKGRLGLMPFATEVGDFVSVIHGSRVPLILRKDAWSEEHKVLGQAYVEGIMHGEAVHWKVDEAFEYQLI